MALYSKKEFADILDMSTKALSVYISRGNVIVKGDKIDGDHPTNRLFQSKRKVTAAKSGSKTANKTDLPEAFEVISAPTSDIITAERPKKGKKLDPVDLDNQKTLLEIEKKQREIALADMKIERYNGTVVPSDLIKPVFLQHNQSMITEFKNAAEGIIRVLASKKQMSNDEKAEVRGQLVEQLNNAVDRATKASLKSVESIIKNFMEARTAGEKK